MATGFIAIGSGPAGVSAAETFRGRHPNIPVRILTSDPALPYAKPPLSKAFLCGRDPKLDLHSPGWFDRQSVELVRGITVEHIELATNEVVTAGGQHYPYWHLVLACGANPVRLDVPGGEAALNLRSYADAVVLRMAALNAESAVVIGGGLIGCGAAACLAGRAVVTTMVAPEPVPLRRRFGLDVGERVAKILSDTGVRFIGSTVVATIDDELVVSALGVRPDARLAKAAGLETHDGPRRRQRAHAHLGTQRLRRRRRRTGLQHNRRRRVPAEHWRDAAQQGLVAGLSAAGFSAVWDRVPEFSCTIGESTLKYRGWGADYRTAGSTTTTTASPSGTKPAAKSSES